MPELFMIAGPNGAGKTTAAYHLLPDVFKTVEFVNADEIAKGLSPLNPEGVALQAGRIMLERLAYLIGKRESVAFETTLSGLAYLKFLKEARLAGYSIIFFYVWLHSFELAINRVASRVSKGGHHIPADVVERRYAKGIKNFNKYALLADDWYIYNNSGTSYELVAQFTDDNEEVFNVEVYRKIRNHD